MTLEDLKKEKAELDKAYSNYIHCEPKVVGEVHMEYKRQRVAYMSMCAEYVEEQAALNKVM